MQGRSVQSLGPSHLRDLWQATLRRRHPIRGSLRFFSPQASMICVVTVAPKDPHQWVEHFKMYYRLSAAQTAELGDASELTLYAGGYGGIQPVEDGITNFCCVVQRHYFARAGPSLGGPAWQRCKRTAPILRCGCTVRRLCSAKPNDRTRIFHTASCVVKRTMGSTVSAIRQQSSPRSLATAYRSPCIPLAAQPLPIWPTSRRRSFSQNYVLRHAGPDASCRGRGSPA